jgi:hypothetical protein
MTYAPPAPMQPKLATITALVAGATPIDADFDPEPAYLATLPGGELYLDGALELDTDGWPGPEDRLDKDHQGETSLLYSDGGSINANAVPFFVLPQFWFTGYGIALGDYAAVLYGGEIAFAVLADEGPVQKIGEGSIELLRRLGQERILDDGGIWDTGMEPPVVTIVFPGSGKGQEHFPNEAALIADLEAEGRRRFIALGGAPDA